MVEWCDGKEEEAGDIPVGREGGKWEKKKEKEETVKTKRNIQREREEQDKQ